MALQRKSSVHNPDAKYSITKWHTIQQEAMHQERNLAKTSMNLQGQQDRMAATTIYHRGPLEPHIIHERSRFCRSRGSTGSLQGSTWASQLSAAADASAGKTAADAAAGRFAGHRSLALPGAAGASSYPIPKTAWSSDPAGAGGALGAEAELPRRSEPSSALGGRGEAAGKRPRQLLMPGMAPAGASAASPPGTPTEVWSSSRSSSGSPCCRLRPSSGLLRRSGSSCGLQQQQQQPQQPFILGSPMHQHEVASRRQGMVPRTDFRGAGNSFTLVLS